MNDVGMDSGHVEEDDEGKHIKMIAGTMSMDAMGATVQVGALLPRLDRGEKKVPRDRDGSDRRKGQ